MRSSDVTEVVARRWAAAWSRGDRDAVATMLTADVAVEHNLTPLAQRSTLLQTIQLLATSIDQAPILSLTVTNQRAALLYDCHLRSASASIRLAEFLMIDLNADLTTAKDVIVGVRRVYDLTAVDQYLPILRDPEKP